MEKVRRKASDGNDRYKLASDEAKVVIDELLERVRLREGKTEGEKNLDPSTDKPNDLNVEIDGDLQAQSSVADTRKPEEIEKDEKNEKQENGYTQAELDVFGLKMPDRQTVHMEKEQLIPETQVSTENPGKKVEKLKHELALARQDYAQAKSIREGEYTLWKQVKKYFVDIEIKEDEKFEPTRNTYVAKLAELQKAEVERIQASGLEGKELEDALAESLRYFQIDERLLLYESKTTSDLNEREGTFRGRVVSPVEKFIGWYQEQSTAKKMAIAAGFFLAAGGASLAGAVVAGGGIAAARFALNAVGTSTVANTVMEKSQKRKRKKKLEEDHEESKKRVLTKDEESIAYLKDVSEKLQKEFDSFLANIDRELEEWQKSDQKRRVAAGAIGLTGGLVLSSGMQAVMEHGGNEMVRGGFEKLGIHLSSTEAPKMSGNTTVTPEIATVKNIPTSPSEVVPGVASTQVVDEYLKEHLVNKGDNLWKYSTGLGKSLGIENNVDQMRFAKLVENAVRARLDAAPELLGEAGFKDEESLQLLAGKNLHLGSLLTPEDIQKLAKETTESVQSAHEGASHIAHTTNGILHADGGTGAEQAITAKPPEMQQAYMNEEKAMGIGAAAMGGAAVISLNERKARPKSPPLEVREEPTFNLAKAKVIDFGEQKTTSQKKAEEEVPPYAAGANVVANYMRELPNDLERENFTMEMKKQVSDVLLLNIYRSNKKYNYEKNKALIHLNVNDLVDLSVTGITITNKREDQEAVMSLHDSQQERLVQLVRFCEKNFGKVAKPGIDEDLKNYVARMTILSRENDIPIELPEPILGSEKKAA